MLCCSCPAAATSQTHSLSYLIITSATTATTAPQVPIIQIMLGQLGIVNSTQMFSLWRYVVVGSTVAAAVLTPSTDPFTQVSELFSHTQLVGKLL